MFDKRLLELNYPVAGKAFVENGKRYQPPFVLDGWRPAGHWVHGVAKRVFRVGQTPLCIEFFDANGTEFIIEHSAQFIPNEI